MQVQYVNYIPQYISISKYLYHIYCRYLYDNRQSITNSPYIHHNFHFHRQIKLSLGLITYTMLCTWFVYAQFSFAHQLGQADSVRFRLVEFISNFHIHTQRHIQIGFLHRIPLFLCSSNHQPFFLSKNNEHLILRLLNIFLEGNLKLPSLKVVRLAFLIEYLIEN